MGHPISPSPPAAGGRVLGGRWGLQRPLPRWGGSCPTLSARSGSLLSLCCPDSVSHRERWPTPASPAGLSRSAWDSPRLRRRTDSPSAGGGVVWSPVRSPPLETPGAGRDEPAAPSAPTPASTSSHPAFWGPDRRPCFSRQRLSVQRHLHRGNAGWAAAPALLLPGSAAVPSLQTALCGPGLLFGCSVLGCFIQNKQKTPRETLKFNSFPKLQSQPQNSNGTSAG